MNILVLYPYIPFPLDRGTFQRSFHLLREMAREHTVDLIALSESGERLEQRPVFEEFCRNVTFVPFQHPAWPKLMPDRLFRAAPTTIRHWQLPQLAQAIREQLAAHSYDVVHICDIVLAQYFLDEHKDIPISVDRSRVDLQFQLQQTSFSARGWKSKLLAWENMAKLWVYERKVVKRCQMQVLCGRDDEIFVRSNISRTVPLQVVANGVDLDFFKATEDAGENDEVPTMVFCGAMDYTPNVDALRWYFDEMHEGVMARVPNLRLFIVGKSPVPEVQAYASKRGVTITGSVDDVRPYYRRSWVQMVPLRIGGGTRLKIVESLAIGTPVVSTSIGAQGLDLVHNVNILLADTAETFVEQIVRALENPTLRKSLRQEGIAAALERFSWHTIGAKLSQSYRRFELRTTPRVRIMKVPFDNVTMPQALDRIGLMVETGKPHYLATANVDFLVQARYDDELRTILNAAHMVVCDGKPLVWLSRLLGRELPERVAGADLVPELLARAEKNDWSVFFLGGQETVLSQAVANVGRKHPKLRIAGAYSPPFTPFDKMDHEGICSRVRQAKPDILLVSFGCPKQEKWIARNYVDAGVPVSIGMGATIDFLAGTVKRAPQWMQVKGLEWVFRLLQEPRRLMKRYAIDIFVFGIGVVREVVRTSFETPPAHHV